MLVTRASIVRVPSAAPQAPRRVVSVVTTLLSILLTACGSVPLDPDPPNVFDLSGIWVLDAGASDPAMTASRWHHRPIRPTGAPRPSGGLAFVTHDFPLLQANRVEIEQHADSMGMAFDSGAYRDLSWGERKRGLWSVEAGWVESVLVVRSSASDADVEETYVLDSGGDQLTVTTALRSGGQQAEVVRVFDRVSVR